MPDRTSRCRGRPHRQWRGPEPEGSLAAKDRGRKCASRRRGRRLTACRPRTWMARARSRRAPHPADGPRSPTGQSRLRRSRRPARTSTGLAAARLEAQAGEAAGQAGRAVLVVSVALVEARAARVRVGQRASRQRRRCECRRPGCQPRRSRGPMTRYRPGSGAGWQRKGVGRAAPLSRPGRSPSPGSARRASARRSRSGSLRAGWRIPSLRLAAGARNAAGQARESIRHCRTAHPSRRPWLARRTLRRLQRRAAAE